jgi:hypothetical protein
MGEKNVFKSKIMCNYLRSQVEAVDNLMLKWKYTRSKICLYQWVKRLTWDRKEDTVNKFVTVPSHFRLWNEVPEGNYKRCKHTLAQDLSMIITTVRI